jgi:hypothetical protein
MMTMGAFYFLRLLFSNLAALIHNTAALILNFFGCSHFQNLNFCMLLLFSIPAGCSYSQFLHAALILNSCMLLLFSILACCSYSQFLHAALIIHTCMLLLFSIPVLLLFSIPACCSYSQFLHACCSYSQFLLLLFVNYFALSLLNLCSPCSQILLFVLHESCSSSH